MDRFSDLLSSLSIGFASGVDEVGRRSADEQDHGADELVVLVRPGGSNELVFFIPPGGLHHILLVTTETEEAGIEGTRLFTIFWVVVITVP